MVDPVDLIPIVAAAVTIILAAIVSAVVANRASAGAFLLAKNAAKKSELDLLQTSYADQQAGYVSLQATYAKENARLNQLVDKLRDENVTMLNELAENKADCQRDIAALRQQVIVLTAKLPNPGDLVPVRIIDVAAPLPVEVKAPIPIPMTMAQAIAAAAAQAASDNDNSPKP